MQTTREQAAAVREQAQAAREQAQAAREQAQAAREQAAAEQGAASEQDGGPEAAQAGNGAQIAVIKDGKTVILSDATPEALQQLGIELPRQIEYRGSEGPFVIAGIGIVATSIVLLVGLFFRYRLKMRGLTTASPAAPAELTQRMARMESSIDAVAEQVERISEGQRFTARLLSERAVEEVRRG